MSKRNISKKDTKTVFNKKLCLKNNLTVKLSK